MTELKPLHRGPGRSSMGSRAGFLGPSVVAFSIMCAVIRAVSPKAWIHECTMTFDASIFAKLFPKYRAESIMTQPTDYGFPIRRTRLYTLLVREDMQLLRPLSDIYRLFITPSVDCGVFFSSADDEAGLAIVGG